MYAYEFEKKLIAILKDNRQRFLDEETLMGEFGLEKAVDTATESGRDLSLAIECLRLQGYDIDGDEMRGWRLVTMPDLINYLEVASGLNTSFLGKCLFTYRIIGSTNEAARMLAEAGVGDGTLLVAEEQKKGRGRLGGSWYSPPGGGIWASLILRPGLRCEQTGCLPMLTSLCICLAVEELTGLSPKIKWPNDIYLDRRKFAGVLCETASQGERLKYIILGFGVNVNIEHFPGELSRSAISLKLSANGKNFYRVALLQEILDKLEEGYFKFLTDGFASFMPRVNMRDYLRDRPIKVQMEDSTLVAGIARGIDEKGALLLETAGENSLGTISRGHVIEC
ncbi:MAG: biotin--[acetyl-CoA-carboxylase] ligase [Gemmatimonadota bacterium]|nr:biotin--[acetyl-CoA-carboxylase] ligase [Gemmatimonadota bacterium]